MSVRSMRLDLLEARAGTITFTTLIRRTQGSWNALGRSLLRRWKAPPSVDLEDMVQELVLAVANFLPKFDPSRGVPIEKFIVYNACDKAKKWLHKQRRAHRRDDSAPSRFDIPISCLRPAHVSSDDFDIEERLANRTSVDADQDLQLERGRVIRELANQSGDIVLLALDASHGDAMSAATKLLHSVDARLALRIDTIEEARGAVEGAVLRAALSLELGMAEAFNQPAKVSTRKSSSRARSEQAFRTTARQIEELLSTVLSVCGGDVERAAKFLISDLDVRLALRIDSIADARRILRGAASRSALPVQTEEVSSEQLSAVSVA